MGGALMGAAYATAGAPCPVFVAGIKYRSIFEAAFETEISTVWLTNSIKKSGGGPVIVKNQIVVTDFWVHERAGVGVIK
jgi:hypothetical protein